MQESDMGDTFTHLTTWKRMKQKKPDLMQPQPSLPEYYGSSEEDLRTYCDTVQAFYPKVDDPFQEDVDERALVLASGGRPHGRGRVLDKVARPDMNLSRVKATLPPAPLSRILDSLVDPLPPM